MLDRATGRGFFTFGSFSISEINGRKKFLRNFSENGSAIVPDSVHQFKKLLQLQAWTTGIKATCNA